MKIFCALSMATVLWLVYGSAWASECTTISTVPVLVNRPGCYELVGDLRSTVNTNDAITVKSNGVTIDLKGFRILGPDDPKTSGAGIYASNVKNFTITGGTITGFLYGIRVDGGDEGKASSAIDISKMIVRDNSFRGISVEATNANISRNSVEKTGGTQLFPEAFAVGIEIKGSDCLVLRNIVDGIFPIGIGEGIGVSLSQNRQGCMILQNLISAKPESRASYGLWLSSEKAETIVAGNKISGFTFPFSIPLNDSRIWATIERNEIVGASCNPGNFKSYFGSLSSSNEFKNSRPACPSLIPAITEISKARPNDPSVVFSLAMAMYQCAAEPALKISECCNFRRQSLGLFRKASDMGVAEAARILPAVTSSVNSDKACKA